MATQETLNQVQQLYVAYYGRPADAAGLAFWADELEANGGDVSVIINDFGNSAEFEARFGDLSNEVLVNNLYQQLFGRDADAEGLAFYTGHLESGDLTLAQIASEIAGGAQDNEDGDNDLTTLNNKVAAANLYTAATEGQHDGTDADNYAAAWLADIDADTDVDAIDMDEVVANLPEPTEPTEPEEPSSTINVEFTDIPGGATNLTQTITEIGRAEWDEAGRPVTTSADYTFQLSNQLGAGENYEGLFLSPMLTSDIVTSNSQLFIELLDVRTAGTDEPLGNLPIDGVRFQLGDETVTLRSDDIFAAKTYGELQAALQAAIAEDSSLAGLSVAQGASFTATDGDEPIPGAVGTTLVLTDAQGREVSNPQFTYSDQETGGFTLYGDLSLEAPESTRELIETNLELNNVGYGSQGGSINIAGESNSDKGVELFNVEATNGVWLTRLESETIKDTHALKEINLTGSGYFNVGQQDNYNVGYNIVGLFDLLTVADLEQQAGLVDVQDFNGQNFDGDIKLSSYISEAVIARDLQRDDTQDDPTAEDVTYAYQTAAGDDQISLVVNEAVLERADAQVFINAGDGNNVVETAFVNDIEALTNQQLNGNITIVTGSGADVVRTWGAGDAEISTGAGNDVIYADNSGLLTPNPDPEAYNRDFWEFNSTAEAGEAPTEVSNSDSGLSSVANGVPQTFSVASGANVQVQVTFKGFESVWVNVPTTRTSNDNDDEITTLQVNQAIKNAVNNDAVLQNLIAANDGNGNILNIASLIDGNNLDELNITFRNNNEDAPADLSDIAAIYGGIDGSEAVAASEVAATSEGGTESTFESDNVINAGAGDDVIVLGTGEFSNDTVVLEGNFGTNSIVNFTAGEVVGGEIITPAVAEVVTVTFSNAELDEESQVVFDDETVGTIGANATAAEIAQLFEGFTSASWTAQVDGDTVTFTATSGGEREDLVSNDFSPAVIVDSVTVDTQGADAVTEATANGADILDFTFYGVNGASLGTDNYDVSNDAVNVVTFNAGDFDRENVSFDNLTAADVSQAIGDEVASGRIDSIILVQSDTNAGEYKAFDVNSANNSTDFTVDLIGVLDFGANQDFHDSNFA